jgi:hypothetical protein
MPQSARAESAISCSIEGQSSGACRVVLDHNIMIYIIFYLEANACCAAEPQTPPALEKKAAIPQINYTNEKGPV